MFDILLQQWQAQSIWEIIAVVLSVAYVFLAARASIWCWPCAFVSTLIFSVLFFDVNLLQEAALNIYYLIMAIVGFYFWLNPKSENNEQQPISQWPLKFHIYAIIIVSIIALLSGYLSDTVLQADSPYINGFTAWFAVFCTYLVARKVLENWIYWMIINPVSLFLFWEQQLYLTAALALLYFGMSVYGYYSWTRLYREKTS